VEVYKKYATGLKTIVYAVNIKHCEELLKEFEDAGINADSIHSKKTDTKKALDDFANNKIDVLINVDVLTTGYDAPDIYCLILASPTKSLIKSTQIYGRATRLNPLDPNKEALIIDCANVIENTQHPLQRFDFTKTKKDNSKICKCGLKFKLVDRSMELLNEFEYVVISDYKCDCGESYRLENIKLININNCENCYNPFISTGGLEIENNTNNLTFNLICSCCGHARKFREIEYTKEELQELEYNEALKGDKWENVKAILKAECKKAGYHHRYALRLMDSLQIRCASPIEAIDKIKMVLSQNQKISRLMYL
jgi:DNA or RNA helicases of superfamily II